MKVDGDKVYALVVLLKQPATFKIYGQIQEMMGTLLLF
jgi:hypothetical protein